MEEKSSVAVRMASVLIIITIIIFGLSILRGILVPLAFSIMLAIILYPLCRKLESWKLPRIGAIIICILVAITIVGLILTLISMQVMSFTENLPELEAKAVSLLTEFQIWVENSFGLKRASQIPMLKNSVREWAKTHGAFFSDTLSATTSTLGAITLLPILIFFFLLYRHFFRNFFYKAFKSVPTTKVDDVLKKIQTVVQNYISGLGSVILIVAALNITGLLILGIDYAIFFGVLGALLTIIPYVGIFIGAILPMLMSLVTKDSGWYAVGVAGVFFFVQILEGNFITPNIVGSKVSVNPLAAIVGLLLGGMLWGAAGMILALPSLAVLKVVFDSVEALEPYGFLLGESEEVTSQNKDLVDTISDEIKKKVNKKKPNAKPTPVTKT